MSQPLYEIISDYDRALAAAIDPDTGEIIDESLFEQLKEIDEAKENKFLNIAAWIKDIKYDIEKFKAEKEVLEKKKKFLENKAESLKEFIRRFIENGKVYEDPRARISWRKATPKVVVGCKAEELPDKFKKVETTARKAEISKALKADPNAVAYCHLDHTRPPSLQIS